MNKKGFTLIELLAIIVILAIIAVITIPILLNVIENARKGAAIDSAYNYKDSVQKYYISSAVTTGNTSFTTGYRTVSKLESQGLIVSGQNPSEGWVKLDQGQVQDFSIKIGEYVLNYDEVTNTVVALKNGEIEDIPGIVNPVSFSEDDWSTIISNVQIGNTSKYNVGDTKTITLNGFGTHTLRIANTSTPEECHTPGFSQTACGFVLEFADVITTHRMNLYNNNGDSNGDGNKGGWEYSDMRAYLNNGVYLNNDTSGYRIDYSTTGLLSTIPEPLKSSIIDTTVVSSHGTKDTDNFITTDKLYLLSTHEVWNTTYRDTVQENTRQLDYYEQNTDDNCNPRNYCAIVIKPRRDSEYWLRSARSDNYSCFIIVSNGGTIQDYYGSSNNSGVSPAFRIGD